MHDDTALRAAAAQAFHQPLFGVFRRLQRLLQPAPAREQPAVDVVPDVAAAQRRGTRG
jgi:hypothetical protein